MARMTVSGLEAIDSRLAKLGRPVIRRLVEAGAKADADEWRKDIKGAGHIRTGDMLESVGPTEYREFLGGGEILAYPLGTDRKGVRNATKAYVINYGRVGGERTNRRTKKKYKVLGLRGDKFISAKDPQTEDAVFRAMQAESDRILDEINR